MAALPFRCRPVQIRRPMPQTASNATAENGLRGDVKAAQVEGSVAHKLIPVKPGLGGSGQRGKARDRGEKARGRGVSTAAPLASLRAAATDYFKIVIVFLKVPSAVTPRMK
jgi:hypothetical protein